MRSGEPMKQRYSKHRETIMQIVANSPIHPNADWIYKETRKTIPNISLGTIYRNLNQLVKCGQIIKLKDDTMIRYDGNTDKHGHFKCRLCGTWHDIDIVDPLLLKKFFGDHNFIVESVSLELEGTCQSCLKS